jgi:hypothetical protein
MKPVRLWGLSTMGNGSFIWWVLPATQVVVFDENAELQTVIDK